MALVLLPFYPEGISMINSSVGIKNIEGIGIVYFNEAGPFYKHHHKDYKSFRFITSQMMDLKQVKQTEVIKFFKISKESAKRWLKAYREKGAVEFFKSPNTRKGGTILTSGVIREIESMLSKDMSIKDIGTALEIKADTIKKGIQSGRINYTKNEGQKDQENNSEPISRTQSIRTMEDALSPMGMGCTNITGRVDAIKKK